MARIDKAWQVVRGIAGTVFTGVHAVTKDAGGSIVKSGSANAIGVVVVPGTIAAGHAIGVHVRGEITEFGGSAGTDYYALGGGSIGTAVGGTRVGYTLEGDRLILDL